MDRHIYDFKLNVGIVQKSVMLGTAGILRKVLDMKGESILLALGLLVVSHPTGISRH